MVYQRRVVKRRPASLTDEEWLSLLSTRFENLGYCRERDGLGQGDAHVWTVLCPFCRERHSPDEVEVCMVLPRKTAAADKSGSSSSSVLDAGPLLPYSELWAFLTATSHPDGMKRRTGKISLSCESAMLGLSLQDTETGQYAYLNGLSLSGLLEEVELRLTDGSIPWRTSRYSNGQSRKKGT